jgi:hypothetical protein
VLEVVGQSSLVDLWPGFSDGQNFSSRRTLA